MLRCKGQSSLAKASLLYCKCCSALLQSPHCFNANSGFTDAAGSKFALNGLLAGIDQSYLQGNIVQITGEVGKDFPAELSAVLQAAHPSQLVITPGALSAKQRKAGVTTSIVLPPWLAPGGTVGQVIQTAQVGAIEVDASDTGWNIQAA